MRRFVSIGGSVLLAACSKSPEPAPRRAAVATRPTREPATPPASASSSPFPASASSAPPATGPSTSSASAAPDASPPSSASKVGFVPSLQAARGESPRTSLGPIRFDAVAFGPDSTSYLHAYSDCRAGVGVKLECEAGAHVSATLLDRSGKALSLKEPGAREQRTAESVDLWSPDACHYFFIEIRNHDRSATTCDLVVWAVSYGP